MFKQIHPLVHSYYFPLQEFCNPYKEKIINLFLKKQPHVKTYSVNFQDNEFAPFIIKNFINLIKKYYIVAPPLNTSLNFYIQNNTNSTSVKHNHFKSSTINATFYLSLPKKGGELEFYIEDKRLILKPQLNTLYVFPYWLDHKPLPQEDNNYRICVNLEYLCKDRPEHKITKILW